MIELLDYIWGMHAAEKIYHPIVQEVKRLEALKYNRPF